MSVPLHRVFHGIKDLRLNECLRCETGVFSCVVGVSDDNPAKRKRTKPRNLLKYNDFARFLRDPAGTAFFFVTFRRVSRICRTQAGCMSFIKFHCPFQLCGFLQ